MILSKYLRKIIQDKRRFLCRSVAFDEIKYDLIDASIFSDTQIDKLSNDTQRNTAQMSQFIKILKTRSDEDFFAFCEILKNSEINNIKEIGEDLETTAIAEKNRLDSQYFKKQGYGLLSNSNYENAFPGLRKCYLIKEQFHYSCKKMKQRYNSRSKFQYLVEVQALKRLSGHPNVVQLRQVLYATETGSAWIITELIEINLDQLIKGFSNQLSKDKITSYVWQLLKAVEYMHSNDIFHDNIKPENILVKGSVVKLTGFEFSRSSYSKLPYLDRPSCLWYRAPECLLTSGYYTCKVDEWSIGCIMFEMITSRRLFFGINEGDQITKIHNILGTPADDVLTKFKEKCEDLEIINFNFDHQVGKGLANCLLNASVECVSIITKLCCYDPANRISAKEALQCLYFEEIRVSKCPNAKSSGTGCAIAGSDVTRKTTDTCRTSQHANESPKPELGIQRHQLNRVPEGKQTHEKDERLCDCEFSENKRPPKKRKKRKLKRLKRSNKVCDSSKSENKNGRAQTQLPKLTRTYACEDSKKKIKNKKEAMVLPKIIPGASFDVFSSHVGNNSKLQTRGKSNSPHKSVSPKKNQEELQALPLPSKSDEGLQAKTQTAAGVHSERWKSI